MSRASHGRSWAGTSLALAAIVLWTACEALEIQLFPAVAPPPTEREPEDGGVDAARVRPEAPTDARAEPEPEPCLAGANACEACVTAAACAQGFRCHPFSGRCSPACGPGLPACPSALACNEALGPGVCVSCTNDDACDGDTPLCDELSGVCVECNDDADCTDDPVERPRCLPNGACGCAGNADCASGICDLTEAHCEDEDEDD